MGEDVRKLMRGELWADPRCECHGTRFWRPGTHAKHLHERKKLFPELLATWTDCFEAELYQRMTGRGVMQLSLLALGERGLTQHPDLPPTPQTLVPTWFKRLVQPFHLFRSPIDDAEKARLRELFDRGQRAVEAEAAALILSATLSER